VQALANYKIVKIATGFSHTAAITQDGKLFLWGKGRDGQLGLGDIGYNTLPVQLELNGVKQVACGQNHTLVVVS